MADQTSKLRLDLYEDQRLLKKTIEALTLTNKLIIKDQDDWEQPRERLESHHETAAEDFEQYLKNDRELMRLHKDRSELRSRFEQTNELSKNETNELNLELAETKEKLLENNQELKRYALENADMEAKLKSRGIEDEIEHTLQDTNMPRGLPATLHEDFKLKAAEEAKIKQKEIDDLIRYTFRGVIIPLRLTKDEYDIVKEIYKSIEGLRAHFPLPPAPKANKTTVESRGGDGDGDGDIKNHASTPTAPGSSLTAQ